MIVDIQSVQDALNELNKRLPGHEYSIEIYGKRFCILHEFPGGEVDEVFSDKDFATVLNWLSIRMIL